MAPSGALAALGAIHPLLQELSRVPDGPDGDEKREERHRRILQLDPSWLPSRTALCSLEVQRALRARDADLPEAASLATLAARSVLADQLLMADLAREGSHSTEGSAWSLLPAELVAQSSRLLSAALFLDLGLLHDFCSAAGASEAGGLPTLRPEDAVPQYAAAASLDGNDRRVWQLWAAAVRRHGGDPSPIHAAAVAHGVWLHAEQRPLQLVPALAPSASAWLDSSSSPACDVLRELFPTIRAEGLALIAGGSGGGGGGAAGGGGGGGSGGCFGDQRSAASARGLASFAGGALASGAWRDLSLFVNGRRHESNCSLAPRTAAALGWRLRADATSNPCVRLPSRPLSLSHALSLLSRTHARTPPVRSRPTLEHRPLQPHPAHGTRACDGHSLTRLGWVRLRFQALAGARRPGSAAPLGAGVAPRSSPCSLRARGSAHTAARPTPGFARNRVERRRQRRAASRAGWASVRRAELARWRQLRTARRPAVGAAPPNAALASQARTRPPPTFGIAANRPAPKPKRPTPQPRSWPPRDSVGDPPFRRTPRARRATRRLRDARGQRDTASVG